MPEAYRDAVPPVSAPATASAPMPAPQRSGPPPEMAAPAGGLLTDPVRPLNATAASLLGFLHDGPMTGWDLVAQAQRRIGDFWSLTQSQVYRELAAMARAGLVRAGERGRRDRQPYAITEAGRAAFAEWAARDPGRETIRFPLLLSVVLGRHVPRERLASHVAGQRAAHAARLASYERRRAAIGADRARDEPHAVAALDFGLAYERAVLAWLDTLPEEVTGDAVPHRSGAGHRADVDQWD